MESEDCFTEDDAAEEPYRKPGRRGGDVGKRRFSEAQIKSLESMFESQAKLEPRKKLQLARELGLQPRQVAIWFQNKRARWKSKQLERQYDALRADYDALRSSFESVKKEKQHLVKQLQKLAEMLKRPTGGSSNNNVDVDSDNSDDRGKECREEEWPGLLQTAAEASYPNAVLYSDEEERKLSYVDQDEADGLLDWGEPASNIGYLASTDRDRLYCFDDNSSPEKICTTAPQWWEFWPTTD